MSEFVDALVARVLHLEINLLACRERMAAGTDAEALHDLRIAIRKLRSLLRPFRKLMEHDPLVGAAGELGRTSSAVRDSEVLLAELQRHPGFDSVIARRQRALPGDYRTLIASAEALRLQRALDLWPSFFRQCLHEVAPAHLKTYVRKKLAKESQRLALALADPAHDRHRLRLLIKRVRYCADTYPELVTTFPEQIKALKRCQNALGAWHDRWQWLARAEQDLELKPLVAGWRRELEAAEKRSDKALQQLAPYFL